MRHILVVDDEQDVASVLVETIEQEFPGVRCEQVTDFSKASLKIQESCPDAIVLDLMEGSHSTNLPGQSTWQEVWKDGFCPIVIYTGWEGDLSPPIPIDHPFVKQVAKGGGSEAAVVARLKEFEPATAAITKLRREVNRVIQQVLRETAGTGVIPVNDDTVLLRAGRRRIAALMDSPGADPGKSLKSWEQYLLPPVGDSPLTGDVLRKSGSDWKSTTDYRLVLTPSCDMVRDRKSNSVLLAKCEGISSLLNAMSLPKKREEAEKRLVKLALTQGVWNGWVPLPEFPTRIPHLAANLKELEVVAYDDICPTGTSSPAFIRVASIDSPFREQVSWAFLTTVARPGMPERDFQAWATECVASAGAPDDRLDGDRR